MIAIWYMEEPRPPTRCTHPEYCQIVGGRCYRGGRGSSKVLKVRRVTENIRCRAEARPTGWSPSLSFEHGRAFLEERLRRFGMVLRQTRTGQVRRLHVEHRFQPPLFRRVEVLLDVAVGDARTVGDLARDGHRLRLERFVRHYAIHEPDPQRFGCIELVTQEHELARLRGADRARQEIGDAEVAGEADFDECR